MGHSTSSGRASGGVSQAEATPREAMSQARLDDHILVNSGEWGLTSRDIDRLQADLDSGASVGDRVEARENNRWHNITDTFTKTEDGWRYQRVNHSSGDTYEDRPVGSRYVAQTVLGTALSRTDPQRWIYRSGSQRGLSESSQRAVRAAEYSRRQQEEQRRRGQQAARNMTSDRRKR